MAGGHMWLDGWQQNVEDRIEETEKKREQRIREIEKEFNKELRPLYDGMSLQLPSFCARLLSFLHSIDKDRGIRQQGGLVARRV